MRRVTAGDRLRETETLLSVSQALGSTLDLTEVLRRVSRETARAFGADTAGAFLAEADEVSLRAIAGYHVPRHLRGRSGRAAAALTRSRPGAVFATASRRKAMPRVRRPPAASWYAIAAAHLTSVAHSPRWWGAHDERHRDA